MVSKRGRTSANGASPRKRQKSVNGQTEVVEFTTRVLLDTANDKGRSKDETEAEPLLGELDGNLDHAFYTVTPSVWNSLKKYKRFSSMSHRIPSEFVHHQANVSLLHSYERDLPSGRLHLG
jgi:hypothetical protein